MSNSVKPEQPEASVAPSNRFHRLSTLLIVFTVAGILLLPVFQFQINPDGISYLDVAAKYAKGDFAGAVNAYWSPLLCWLTAPLLLTGLPGQIAIKFVLLGGGIVLLAGLWNLLETLGVTGPLRFWTTAVAVPMTLVFSLWIITPDLLVTTGLVWYLAVSQTTSQPLTHRRAILVGAVSAMTFLAKAFAFPFIVIHLPITILFRRGEGSRLISQKTRFIGVGLGVLFLLSLPWLCALKWKYGRFMLNSVTPHAKALAIYPPGGDNTPVGFLEPRRGLRSAWEDSTFIPARDWNPLASKENLFTQIKTSAGFLRLAATESLPTFSLLYPLIFLMIVAGIATRTIPPGKRNRIGLLVFTILLYIGGYSLVYLETRYLWATAYFLLVLAALSFSILPHWFPGREKHPAVLLFMGIVLGSFSIRSIGDLTSVARGQVPELSACRDLYEIGASLRTSYGVTGRIASNDNWPLSLHLTYFVDGQYLGKGRPGASETEIRAELARVKADYYVVWPDRNGAYPTVSFGEQIAGETVRGVRIYRLKQ